MKKQPTVHLLCCNLDRSVLQPCSNITIIKATSHVPVLPLTEDGTPSVLFFIGMTVISYSVPGFRPTKSKRALPTIREDSNYFFLKKAILLSLSRSRFVAERNLKFTWGLL